MKSPLLLLFFLTLGLRTPAQAQSDGLYGRVMCGYQGWFRTPDDGTNTGWYHYSPGKIFGPGTCGIDLWPDVRELPDADRTSTPFLHPDGSTAEVFSSVKPSALKLHFQWMQTYGIDGIFLQRFAVTTKDARFRRPMDAILEACRASAQDTGRVWSLMYDLSGLRPGEVHLVIEDWQRLTATSQLGDAQANPTYLRHRGKPLVALWGLGFSDRAPMLDEWRTLIEFFKRKAAPEGCTVMLGVPCYWRTLDRDSISDPALHELLELADIISPWTIGRYHSPKTAATHFEKTVTADLAWCRDRSLDYLPVAFPGFSWHNLQKGRGKEAPVNEIPRLGGEFLWSQFALSQKSGAGMQYVAMFDEVDEGTAIFKVRQDPPTGASPFVAEPGVPGDQYLWLTGQAGRLLRRELQVGNGAMPARRK